MFVMLSLVTAVLIKHFENERVPTTNFIDHVKS